MGTSIGMAGGSLAEEEIQALPLGLVLFGTTNVVLADGSTQFRITAYGTAQVGPAQANGIIILEPTANEVLVGTDFLNRFNKTLMIFGQGALNPQSKPVILLVDNQDIAQSSGVQAAAAAAAAPAAAVPAAPPAIQAEAPAVANIEQPAADVPAAPSESNS